MVCPVLPFITKGLTIILEHSLALTLSLLFLLLILLYVTILKSNTVYSIPTLMPWDLIRRSLYLWTTKFVETHLWRNNSSYFSCYHFINILFFCLTCDMILPHKISNYINCLLFSLTLKMFRILNPHQSEFIANC